MLGDNHGNLVHLFERDCSVQRRYQKVVEYAPAWSLPVALRARLADDALKVARQAHYTNAGTVEFLVGEDGSHYFIEVNPRIQVEHTVTEVITGRDLVQAQIRIAQGYKLSDPEIDIPNQAADRAARRRDPGAHHRRGSQERLPARHRQDLGLPAGAVASASASTTARATWARACRRSTIRCWRRSRRPASSGTTRGARRSARCASSASAASRPTSTSSRTCSRTRPSPPARRTRPSSTRRPRWCSTRRAAIARRASCATSPRPWSTATPPCAASPSRRPRVLNAEPPVPHLPPAIAKAPPPPGTKQILDQRGPEGVVRWLKADRRLRLTDTTWRDAHQSLLATRVRTYDLARIAPGDRAPLRRLLLAGDVGRRDLRRRLPLPVGGSVAAPGGAAQAGPQRHVPDAGARRQRRRLHQLPRRRRRGLHRGGGHRRHGRVPHLRRAQRRRQHDRSPSRRRRRPAASSRPSICYTGDVSDPSRTKFDLKYYVDMAKEICRRGTHLLASRTWRAC